MTEVLERFDDGRMNIVVTGEQPFRVLDRFEAGRVPGRRGRADRTEADGGRVDEDAGERRRAREAFAELVERVSGERARGRRARGATTAYAIAARVELPADTKQQLLELRSEPERMRVLGAALRALVAAVERSREVAERARMNGKVIVG